MPAKLNQFHFIGQRRIPKVLTTQVVANMRTLEQKLSDSGPGNMRVDPHILTEVRNFMVKKGTLIEIQQAGINWYHLPDADPNAVQNRLDVLAPLFLRAREITLKIGQALEIATFRALSSQATLSFLGHFRDLDAHDDSTLYSKIEPPNFLSGKTTPSGKELDFILQLDQAGFAGLELKNVREWFYPARPQVRDFLLKCCALDVVPVLIVRRRHISLFNVLNPCGVITHETYNQLYPETERALALDVSHKDLLGYHDVRVGNFPDQRLTNFITINLPKLLPAFRKRFDLFKDLLSLYANQSIDYREFVAKVKERTGRSSEKPKSSSALPITQVDWERLQRILADTFSSTKPKRPSKRPKASSRPKPKKTP
jgi:hypothetical protein